MVLGGALPATLLLRLSFMGSSVYVSVADWISDRTATQWLRPKESLPPSGRPPTWGPAGALAAVFVPRWVRGSLACADGDMVQVALVSLPKATGLVVQPQTEGFAHAVSAVGDDPLAILTPLFNRFPAVAAGDVLSLEVFGARHAVEVLAIRGLPHVRCGRPETSAVLDVNAALASLQGAAGGTPSAVSAACTVDADVEIDFTPSSEAEGDEARARQAAAAAEVARQHQAAEAADAAAAKADPWSAVNAGEGHRLGGEAMEEEEAVAELAATTGAAEGPSGLSEREKRLAALQKRGL